MKVLLVQPGESKSLVGFRKLARPEPLALEILAAVLLDEHEVRIADLRVDPDLKRALRDFQPDVVGVTGYTVDVPNMLHICQQVKEEAPEITTVVGGYHATLCPQDFNCHWVDVIVVGEGEETLAELVRALEKGEDLHKVPGLILREDGAQVATGTRPLLTDLDSSPPPARELTAAYRDQYHFQFWPSHAAMETARGCPYRCKFCSVWVFHRKRCRFKSPERVLEELRTLVGDIICFVDDNFFQRLPRAERIADMIRSEGLKFKYWIQARSDSIVRRPDLVEKWASIGLSTVLVGFEKYREEELDDLDKRSSVRTNEEAARILRANGVDIWGAFIVDPQWDRPDFDALIEYVRRLKISFPQFTVLTPLPGTEFFREKLQELTTRNYELFDFLHSVLPTRLPLQEFYENMARLYASTTMSLSDLKERIRTGRLQVASLRRVKDLLSELTNPESYLQGLRDLQQRASEQLRNGSIGQLALGSKRGAH
ncbi:MAG: cobalamin B12-binding domain-containing protein [Anaerolineae bacterium]|nr:cobalamin B12-binding domain-containing protein [Anaerolineae bacterium]